MKEIYSYEVIKILKKPWFYMSCFFLPFILLLGSGFPTFLINYFIKEVKEGKVLISGNREIAHEIHNELISLVGKKWKIREVNDEVNSYMDKDTIFIKAMEKEIIVKMKNRDLIKEKLIEKAIQGAYLKVFLTEKGLNSQEIEKIKKGLPIRVLTEKRSGKGKYFGLIILVIFYTGITVYGDYLSRRIIIDKDTNFLDILLIYKNPSQIFWGKLLAVDTCYFIYLGITLSLTYLLLKFLPSRIPDIIAILILKEIDLKSFLLIFLIFFMAFLMYSSFYLLSGVISRTEDDLKGAKSIINYVLSFSLLLNVVLMAIPPIKLTKVLYYIPPVSPFSMLTFLMKEELDTLKFASGSIIIIFTTIIFIKIAGTKFERSSLYERRIG
ncbi:MAG: ABC transporter permease [candidate division WOR-3 bacterium]